MKNCIFFIYLVIFFTSHINCGAIEKQVNQVDESEPNFIDKIRGKATNFIGKVQQGTDVAVQKLKSGFQESKCRLHQVREKFQHHTHEKDPCGDDVEVEENQVGHKNTEGNPSIHKQLENGEEHSNNHEENVGHHNNPKVDVPKDNNLEKPGGRRLGPGENQTVAPLIDVRAGGAAA